MGTEIIKLEDKRGGGYEIWEYRGHHCPNCGTKGLWEGVSRDDYYAGTPFLCLSCGHVHNIMNAWEPDGTSDRIKAILAEQT